MEAPRATAARSACAPSRCRGRALLTGTGRLGRTVLRRAVGSLHALVLAGKATTAKLLELLACRRLLGEHRGLDPVEQALEPSHQLGLRDADLGLARHTGERRRQVGQLLLQVGRQHLGQLADGAVVDVGQARPPRFVQRGLARLVQQFAHHARDAQELRGLRDRLVPVALGVPARGGSGVGAGFHRHGFHDLALGCVGFHAHGFNLAPADEPAATGDQAAGSPRLPINSASASAIDARSSRSTLSSSEW